MEFSGLFFMFHIKFNSKNNIFLKNILVIFAHPKFEESPVSKSLIKLYQNSSDIIFKDLYEEYPDFNILVFREIRDVSRSSQIIFHLPVVWFGLPPLLKLWMDKMMSGCWHSDISLNNPLFGKKVNIVVSFEDIFSLDSNETNFDWEPETYLQPLLKFIEMNKMDFEDYVILGNNVNISEIELEKYRDQIKNILEKA